MNKTFKKNWFEWIKRWFKWIKCKKKIINEWKIELNEVESK